MFKTFCPKIKGKLGDIYVSVTNQAVLKVEMEW